MLFTSYRRYIIRTIYCYPFIFIITFYIFLTRTICSSPRRSTSISISFCINRYNCIISLFFTKLFLRIYIFINKFSIFFRIIKSFLNCFTIAFLGSVKIRNIDSSSSGFSEAIIGKRPTSSGINPNLTMSSG